MDRRIQVAVLGATGLVGQRMVQLLAGHPWFELAEVAASEQSAGKRYAEAARWFLAGGCPENAGDKEVLPCRPDSVKAPVVFSALDAEAASEIESAFRRAGRVVISNARSHRWDPEVPLVIPEINASHLELAERQKRTYGGAIVTNPNCTTIGLCLALEPLRLRFGLRRVMVTTMQALSGAGYPGVPALDIMDNVLPEIAGEETKVEQEPRKIFGRLTATGVELADLAISAQCNRVATREGHLLSVSVELERKADLQEVQQAFITYISPLAGLGLPSAPARPVVFTTEPCRPQPLRDREAAGGMAVTVGRLRECPVLDYRFVALVHNTVRGAAGGTALVGELLAAREGA
ncbi:MAG: aspartate-semialdehyde dehydrogenase [candidate division KSB1 bacterium]|nr:aspartate-semialdehyde dehydrogenase [candidate division KSB1 bacterium]